MSITNFINIISDNVVNTIVIVLSVLSIPLFNFLNFKKYNISKKNQKIDVDLSHNNDKYFNASILSIPYIFILIFIILLFLKIKYGIQYTIKFDYILTFISLSFAFAGLSLSYSNNKNFLILTRDIIKTKNIGARLQAILVLLGLSLLINFYTRLSFIKVIISMILLYYV